MPRQVGSYSCVIGFYQVGQEFDWMANTYQLPRPAVMIDGKPWKTTEHYFQAMKYPDNEEYKNNIMSYRVC